MHARSGISRPLAALAASFVLGTASLALAQDDMPHHHGAAMAMPGMAMPATDSAAAPAAERPFLEGNDAAMAKMMNDMAVRPTGDIDRDFVDMMVPHHQGAIDMAELLLRYGHNEQLKRLAQEIIVTQQQEIAAMRLAVGEPLPPSIPSPTQSPAK